MTQRALMDLLRHVCSQRAMSPSHSTITAAAFTVMLFAHALRAVLCERTGHPRQLSCQRLGLEARLSCKGMFSADVLDR